MKIIFKPVLKLFAYNIIKYTYSRWSCIYIQAVELDDQSPVDDLVYISRQLSLMIWVQ